MTEFIEDNNIEELMQRVFGHIKTQLESSQMSESSFTLGQIMHLYVKFHKLALTRGSS